MDKNILKKFAVESRKLLQEKIADRINLYYVDENFNEDMSGEVVNMTNDKHNLILTKEEHEYRFILKKRIEKYNKEFGDGLSHCIEEVAFTWFNRLVCLRYMELHNFLPLTKDNESLDIRVLSSRNNEVEPEIMKNSNLNNPELDIKINYEELDKKTNINDRYEYVLLKVCKKMGDILPQIFDGETDYIELLIPKNLLNTDSFLDKLIKEVPEDNFNDIEIIGWFYQYYNQSEKDKAMKEKRAYKKNEIPYVTQIFTPDWIVKYMVENSLGRLWVEKNGDEEIIKEFKYFIKDNIEIDNKGILPENISFIDPCMGSGHILIYAFEVFMKLYQNAGYNKKDIPELILKNNLYGLDIDDRAGQFAIISIMLKAREYDKDIFNKIDFDKLNILSIKETDTEYLKFTQSIREADIRETIEYLIETFKNAKEIGSLLIVEDRDYKKVADYLDKASDTVFNMLLRNNLKDVIRVAKILSKKYDVVVTNPPYMLKKSYTNNLKKYIEKYYKLQATDLCVAFMSNSLCNSNGYNAIINMQSWMFLQSFEDYRKEIIDNYCIYSMLHLGANAFDEINGEVVQTVSFIYKKEKNIDSTKTIYYRLVDYNTSAEKEKQFLNKNNSFLITNNKFALIKGYTFAYWISDKSYKCLIENENYGQFINTKVGLSTGENDLYLRGWYEINNANDFISNNSKYKEYIYGGSGVEYKKWYGNRIYVINWENNGYRIKNNNRSTIRNEEVYFKETVAFSTIASGTSRYYPPNAILDVNFRAMYIHNNKILTLKNILALLNSVIAKYYCKIFSSTLALNVYDIERLPIINTDAYKKTEIIVDKNINISKADWDSFETSWDFKKHPLV